jgi:hypothetical protein
MPITYTYDDNARREDLLDIITNISPRETQLLSGLGTSKAKDILHQWLTDTLATASANAHVEGVDATYPDTTDPTRLTNFCQIFRKGISVSDTEREINAAGFSDRLTYEVTKKLRELKNDIEYAITRGSLACGSGSAARQLKGIKYWLLSNNYSNISGTTLTEALLNHYMGLVWTDGVDVNAIYCPLKIKQTISAFTSGATKYVELNDKRLVNAVDVYESDTTNLPVKLFKHRYISTSDDGTYHDLVGINEDYFKVAYLRMPQERELAKTGDATNKEVIAELTLECLHENAGFYIAQAAAGA